MCAFFQGKTDITSLQLDILEFPYVQDRENKGKELPDDRRPGSAGHSEVEDKDKDRIQDRIDDGSDQHTCHGIFWTAVCAGKVAHAVGDDEKGHAQGNDAGVGLRIGHDVCCGSECSKERCHEDLDEHCIADPESGHHADSISDYFCSLILLACSQVERESGGASDTDQESDRQADGRQRIGYICGCVSQISDSLPDKDLIDDVVERADQHGDDAGDRKAL